MIALYLIVAHLVGDYLFQTRWQAAGKCGWASIDAFALRFRHVTTYVACFVPIAIVYSSTAWRAWDFLAFLFVLHFATDAQRFRSTLGDRVAWSRMGGGRRALEWNRRLPPSPWDPLPILIDQTLHFAQIALLAGLLLR